MAMTHWTRFWTFRGLHGRTTLTLPRTTSDSQKTQIPGLRDHDHLSEARIHVLTHITRMLRQHTRDADVTLSDRDMFLNVLGRWLAHQAGELIDPNE